MDLSTTYMGLKLKNPLVPSASPLSREIGNIKKLEDAGASAVVVYSLFEEQITHDALEYHYHTSHGTESFPEALTYFPESHSFRHGPEEYLEHLRKAKEAVEIPVIGSLNGISVGGWVDYATRIQSTGVDALELNVYYIATDPEDTALEVETRYLDVLRAVKNHVKIPVAVKLSPFFSSLPNFARRLDNTGANALVLFNRFYQPDIDLENLEVVPDVMLSRASDMRLPLRWVAILHGRIGASIAASSGIHSGTDVIKMTMAGADISMLCASLLKNGIGHLTSILGEIQDWMEEHEYESIAQMKGSMSQKSCSDPAAFERANYMKALTGYTLTDDLLYHN